MADHRFRQAEWECTPGPRLGVAARRSGVYDSSPNGALRPSCRGRTREQVTGLLECRWRPAETGTLIDGFQSRRITPWPATSS